MPGESAAISASTRTRAPTCVNLTLPWACDPLAGRTTAVAEGPAGGGVVAHDARNSAQAASFNPLFMLHPPEKAGRHRRNGRKRIAGRGCASLAQCRKRRMEPALESPL